MAKIEDIQVLGEWINIEYVDLTGKGTEEEPVWGDCNTAKRVIRLEITMDVDMTKRVLRHEVMHMRLGLSGLNQHLTEKMEEALCELAEIDMGVPV